MKISVPKHLFDKMCKSSQCNNISEGFVNKTFFFQNKEIVITGTISSAKEGYTCIWGHYVVDIEFYKDDLQPLSRDKHWDEVMRGKRERGYKAQITSFGKRNIVFIGDVVSFVPVQSEVQLELF